jgi:hypothetical protein
MPRMPHQSDLASDRRHDELVLHLAADLRGVSGRIAELRALCVRQLNDLRSALQTITTVSGPMAGDPTRAEPLRQAGALVGEIAVLHRRFEAQVAAGQRIADAFLEVAREVEAEARGMCRGNAAGSAPDVLGNAVISLPAHRSAPENAATNRRRVAAISASLRRLEAALAVLSEAQAQSVPEMATLMAGIAAFERRTAGPAA